MTRKEKIVVNLLKPINPSVIIILGFYTIVWGLWLLSPWWTVFTQAPLYSTMAGIAGETFWGCTAIASGCIVSYGALRPSYFNIHVGAFAGCLHWLVIAVFYFLGAWTSTGGISALAFATYCAFVWLNVKMNKRLYIKDSD